MSPAIREDCPCPNVTCRRDTFCHECKAAHVPTGGLPFCRRPPNVSLWSRFVSLFRR